MSVYDYNKIYMKNFWRGDRVVEGAALEKQCAEWYRGFESLPLRQLFSL